MGNAIILLFCGLPIALFTYIAMIEGGFWGVVKLYIVAVMVYLVIAGISTMLPIMVLPGVVCW